MSKTIDQGISRRRFVSSAGALAAVSILPPGALGSTAAPEAVELASKRREELIELLMHMIRVQSLSGESAADVQAVVSQYLAALPYRIEESADRPSRYESHAEFMPPNPPGDGPFINLVGWPEGNRAGNHAMFSHIDTNSIAPGWASEPLEPVMRGNRLYGLGASDDKGGVAAMLVAAAALAEIGSPLPVLMSLHGKGGGSRGSLPIFERLRGTDHGIDAVLYVHPAETGRGLADIKNSVQGVVDLELKITGWRGPQMEIGSIDSSAWDQGGNAIDMAWRALEYLRRSAFAEVLVNLGMIDGGDRAGAVAESASTLFRLKFSGRNTWKDLLASGRDALATFAGTLPGAGQSYAFSLEPVAYRTNPGEADWDAPVSRVLRNAIRDVTGRAPDAYPNHYAGDIRYPIRLLDVPAYGIGSIGGNFYGPNEWVDIDDLVQLVAVLIQTLSGWSELNA